MAGMTPDDHEDHDGLDDEWQQIVSHLGELDQSTSDDARVMDTDPSGRSHISGDRGRFGAEGAAPERPHAGQEPAGDDFTDPDSMEEAPAFGPRGWTEPDAADADFVAPDPGPVTVTDPITAVAWVLIAISAIAAVVIATGLLPISRGWAIAAGLTLLGSVITLMVRLPDQRGEDDPDDDGAVV